MYQIFGDGHLGRCAVSPFDKTSKKIYEPILKPDFITYLQTHLGKLSDITEGIYDYATFESTFAKEFNIPKRSLKKYLEPNYDYQISDFAKGVTNVYIRTKYPPKNAH